MPLVILDNILNLKYKVACNSSLTKKVRVWLVKMLEVKIFDRNVENYDKMLLHFSLLVVN